MIGAKVASTKAIPRDVVWSSYLIEAVHCQAKQSAHQSIVCYKTSRKTSLAGLETLYQKPQAFS